MQIQTKFLWLPRAAAIGDRIHGWRVCWLGGWDKCRVFFVVMVLKEYAAGRVQAGIERRQFVSDTSLCRWPGGFLQSGVPLIEGVVPDLAAAQRTPIEVVPDGLRRTGVRFPVTH